MQTMATRFVSIGAALVMTSAIGAAQPAPRGSGHWEGKLHMPNQELPLAVDLDRTPAGAWIGSMTVKGSTSVDVPLSNIAVSDTTVRWVAALPQDATFQATFSADGSTLSGTASNGQGVAPSAPFQLTRSGEAHVAVPPPSSALPKAFAGRWEGTLDANGTPLRLAVKLWPGTDGRAMASLTSIDQGNQEIPVTTVTIEGKELRLDVRAVSGTYQGTLGATGEIAGEWAQGPGRAPLTLKRVAADAKTP